MNLFKFPPLIILLLFCNEIFGQTVTCKDLIGTWKETTHNKVEWDFINDSVVNFRYVANGKFEAYKYSLQKIDGDQVFQYQLKRDATSPILISKILKIDNYKLELGGLIVKFYDSTYKKWTAKEMHKAQPAYLVKKN